MNGNCAGGTDWLRNLESSCPVEIRTVAAHESEESSVLGGHSPAVPRTEGKDKVLDLVAFKGDYFLGFEGCSVLENVPVSQGSLHWGVCALPAPGCPKGHKFTAEFSIFGTHPMGMPWLPEAVLEEIHWRHLGSLVCPPQTGTGHCGLTPLW